MSTRCLRCFRPKKHCLCSYIQRVDPGIKVVFLMHPWEAYKQRTGTGRLAHLSLENSEILIGKEFGDHPRVNALLDDPETTSFVLYPGKEVLYPQSSAMADALAVKKAVVFLLDGTWVLARKMMHRSPNLQRLPRISFTREYRSMFAFKTQPADFCLSTIESVYYLLREFQEAGHIDLSKDFSGLMSIFQRMVRFQLDCEERNVIQRNE